MTITSEDLLRLLPGTKAVVTDCEAAEHGNNSGCLCKLKGSVVRIGKLYDTPFAGTPSWHLEGLNKTARLDELTLVMEE